MKEEFNFKNFEPSPKNFIATGKCIFTFDKVSALPNRNMYVGLRALIIYFARYSFIEFLQGFYVLLISLGVMFNVLSLTVTQSLCIDNASLHPRCWNPANATANQLSPSVSQLFYWFSRIEIAIFFLILMIISILFDFVASLIFIELIYTTYRPNWIGEILMTVISLKTWITKKYLKNLKKHSKLL